MTSPDFRSGRCLAQTSLTQTARPARTSQNWERLVHPAIAYGSYGGGDTDWLSDLFRDQDLARAISVSCSSTWTKTPVGTNEEPDQKLVILRRASVLLLAQRRRDLELLTGLRSYDSGAGDVL